MRLYEKRGVNTEGHVLYRPGKDWIGDYHTYHRIRSGGWLMVPKYGVLL